jgi:DHA1 family inner membrane transport protein
MRRASRLGLCVGITEATAPVVPEAPVRARHLGLALLALSMGGFAIGTTEFVTMGLLPEIASGVGVSIPQAGHLISAYALGVVVGAPLLAYFGAQFPRRPLLVGLMVVYAAFNLLSALAPGFASLAVARFVDGLPHGGYFGVASLVAADLAPPGRKGRAVAMVMIGLSVANVVGVPAATTLGQALGWRWAYVSAGLLALLTVALVLAFVPDCPGDPDATGRKELAGFRRPQVWLTLLAGAIGFGGMFAVMSYIAPLVTDVAGLSPRAVPAFLLALGLGMVFGTWLAGALADWSALRSLLASALGLGAALLVFGVMIPLGWVAVLPAFAITVVGSILVVNLQLRLMDVAGDAQTLGAAMNHASLNVANALGAWLGGIVIAAGFGYTATAYVGVALSVAGFLVLACSALLAVRVARR